ncbi:MAG: ribosome biogenesis GTP-binding protein YihA/YsxC [Gammaproteobacteria bacterium]
MQNRYQQTRYDLSVHELSQLPQDDGREVAFCGRSNAGKSSVINVLTAQNRLARSSKLPGRTRQLNFFTVEPGIRLVDLPGYGYAQVSRALQKHWHTVINAYLGGRDSLAGLILIVDIRRELNEQDKQLLAWCGATALPVHILLNKADKLPRGRAKNALLALQREWPAEAAGGQAVSVQLFSALKQSGVPELRTRLDGWLYGERPVAGAGER